MNRNEFHSELEGYGFKIIDEGIWRNASNVVVNEVDATEIQIAVYTSSGRSDYGKTIGEDFESVIKTIKALES